MAGHNKWSKIKHTKGVLDARRGKVFSRLAKEITVAVKLAGPDPGFNPRLRTAIQAAKGQNMPNDNIDRAIKRGTGEDGGALIEELMYEGYAPGGVALIVEAATDNKNRTAADVRSIFSKNNGNLAASGSVSFQFDRKGRITIPVTATTEDALLEVVLEAGADELSTEEEGFVVLTPPDQLYAVGEAIREAGIAIDHQELTFLPQNTVQVTDEKTAAQILRLHDALDDCDDVLKVHANFDIPDTILSTLGNS